MLSGDEDGAVPPRMRLDEEVYEQLREMQRSFTKEMYAFAVAYLQRTLERTRTEGIGDCWLLTIMAGFEVKDRELVKQVNAEQRESICTSRRRAIVESAANSKLNGSFKLLCEMCGICHMHMQTSCIFCRVPFIRCIALSPCSRRVRHDRLAVCTGVIGVV